MILLSFPDFIFSLAVEKLETFGAVTLLKSEKMEQLSEIRFSTMVPFHKEFLRLMMKLFYSVQRLQIQAIRCILSSQEWTLP